MKELSKETVKRIKEDEYWKEIPGHEGWYWASNLGNIKSRRGLMRPSINSRGYKTAYENQIGSVCKGKCKITNGFKWRYKNPTPPHYSVLNQFNNTEKP